MDYKASCILLSTAVCLPMMGLLLWQIAFDEQ